MAYWEVHAYGLTTKGQEHTPHGHLQIMTSLCVVSHALWPSSERTSCVSHVNFAEPTIRFDPRSTLPRSARHCDRQFPRPKCDADERLPLIGAAEPEC